MAKKIVKSVRLDDEEVIKEFVAKQSNFSVAISYLIMNYCKEHGVEDLRPRYVDFKLEMAMGAPALAKEKEDSPKEEPKEEIEKVTPAPKKKSEDSVKEDIEYSEYL